MLSVVILAAGKGTRMRSSLPKVLHPLAHLSLLEHVINTAESLGADDIHVVYGHGGEIVPKALAHKNVDWVLQDEQLGTGHEVSMAIPNVKEGNRVLVLYGDVPLTSLKTLENLVAIAGEDKLGLLTVDLADPTGYGRIVRTQSGSVTKIVEHKDANNDELGITEVNTGILCAGYSNLKKWLNSLENNNAQGEYYLTDIIEMAVNDGITVETAQPSYEYEVLGVNNKLQLAELERHYQLLRANELMVDGVTLRDPNRVDIRGVVKCGQDVVLDINCVFEGLVELGNGVTVGPNCVIKNAKIGDNVSIQANTVIEDAVIGADSRIGPFARIRPQTELAEQTHIGNFVEIKKSTIGTGSKVNHLSYVGDSKVGSGVNIGAGVITCNYDGANKFVTEIGDNVFVGSDTQLVAPVKISDGVTIGAGSTITKNVEPDVLALSRAKQITVKGWKRPAKKQN